eukprot:TRINITY_DN21913_c0_g1_i1.p2 TRINITY_DN21913_c0_g1~~TRINITY_DN21913_c0_g1_i1.p2  ORF type:complete len:100 (-),score=24.31 TRINITY_DN21913_c0_g1_i1:97-396(-)
MELLFVTVLGAGIGLLVRYLVPSRGSYGILLLPAVGAAATAITWVGLLWAARLTFDGTWIWVTALAAAVLASLAFAILLPRRRAEEDEQLFAKLSAGKA